MPARESAKQAASKPPRQGYQARAAIARRLRRQAAACERLGSALYADLLFRAAADVEQAGIAWDVLAGHERDAPGSAIALRLLGAVHRIVLAGRDHELGAHYPSVAGSPGPDAGNAFLGALGRHRDEVRDQLSQPVQTNEVGRAAALLGGFLLVAQQTALPLRLLELGASAGLNLLFDRYRYNTTRGEWGDPNSPVGFDLTGTRQDLPVEGGVEVVERRGCDTDPLDVRRVDDRLTLKSYVWPDQNERLRLLDAALAVAQTEAVAVDRAGASDWLDQMLATRVAGAATVVFHSIVWQYLAEAERGRLRSLLDEAGRRASAAAPLAHLSMEPAGHRAELRLRVWPGTCQRLIATAGYHGRPVTWLDD